MCVQIQSRKLQVPLLRILIVFALGPDWTVTVQSEGRWFTDRKGVVNLKIAPQVGLYISTTLNV